MRPNTPGRAVATEEHLRSPRPLAPLVLLVSILATLATSGSALPQCLGSVTNTLGPFDYGPSVGVRKAFHANTAGVVMVTMASGMNGGILFTPMGPLNFVVNSSSMVGFYCRRLKVSPTSASCTWQISGCTPFPTITIGLTDGLPVELFDFGLEEETEIEDEGGDFAVEEPDS